LAANTAYNFKLTATNESGSASSETNATTKVAPPVAPASFTSSSQTDNSVTLSWTAQSNLSGYTLEYKKSTDGSWTTAAAPATSAASATINGLTANTAYNFRLTATNESGSASSETNATTKVASPVAPASFTSSSQTDNSVTLSWTAQSNLSGYTLQYKKSTDSNWTTATAPATSAASATITGLAASTAYNFKLTATNESGSASSETNATTKVALPTTPSDFKSVGNTNTSAFFSWTASSGAEKYELQYKKSGEENWTSLTVTDTKVTVTGLSENTQYDFMIRANNVAGDSGWTSVVSVDTTNIVIQPPPNLRSTQAAQTTLTLTWNQVEGATEYILQRQNGTSYDTVYTGTDSQYVDHNLAADTSYSYRVQAVGSAFSTDISAKTAAKIVNGKEVTDAPVVLSTVTSNDTTTVAWTDLGSNYRYLVYKDAQLVVNLERVTSYADSNPSATTTYSVYAYNDTLKKWSWATPIVVTTSAPKIEITGHEILSDGSIKLTWSGVGTNYMVYQSGFPASGTSYLRTTQWTDTQPLADNQYQIYASYRDPADGRTKWTWSNLYFVKNSPIVAPAAPTASPSAMSPLDAFWAEYDYDLIVDDEMLSAVM
jgi:hypothetical protein